MRRRSQQARRRNQKGFTFLEVIVVVAILILLATIVVVNYGQALEQKKFEAAKLQIKEVGQALELYKIDNGFYPTTEQGLQALMTMPESEPIPKKWKKYLETIPKDPWGNDYIYLQPGSHKDFDIYCYGPDAVEGGNDDFGNWEDTTTPTP